MYIAPMGHLDDAPTRTCDPHVAFWGPIHLQWLLWSFRPGGPPSSFLKTCGIPPTQGPLLGHLSSAGSLGLEHLQDRDTEDHWEATLLEFMLGLFKIRVAMHVSLTGAAHNGNDPPQHHDSEF